MKRNEWTVQYTGAKLAATAHTKLAYHTTRMAFWSDKKEEVICKIKAEGMTVSDSLVDELRKTANYSNTAMGSNGPQVTIRPDLLLHLEEAHGKVRQHDHLIAQYKAWLQMMEAHPESVFNLQHDDWMFFFGR